jgi:hypothetical protein
MLEKEKGKLFFSRPLVPFANHAIVAERGKEFVGAALAHHLCNYLEFTETLEHEVVNKVVYGIARDRFGLSLPHQMQADAWNIYVDESYHAKFSADLVRDVVAATGILPMHEQEPEFLAKLSEIMNGVEERDRPLAKLLFAVVSETLITGTLVQVPRDAMVVSAVRNSISDHAHDECKHHAYFASLLRHVWPQLSFRQRRVFGPLLPEFIRGFLTPDLRAVHGALSALGLELGEAEIICDDSYPAQQITKAINEASRATRRLFAEVGVFDEPGTEEAFRLADFEGP